MSSLPPIIIQNICTSWTKASRGGINASARNRTPEAWKLPALPIPSSENALFLHEIVYGEQDLFQHPIERLKQREITNPFRHDCFKFSFQGNTLRITFEWERSYGVPKRLNFPRTEFFLQEHQWMRIIYNLRTSYDYGWGYKKQIYNISFFSLASPNIFTEEVPAHTYIDMAQLR
jgi:hypothetical protein